MVKENEQDAYALIFKKEKFIGYCHVRGSMPEPGNWHTFKPIEFLALSSKIPDGKYNLELLEGDSQSKRSFSIVVKDLDFKVRSQEPSVPAATQPAKTVIAERAPETRPPETFGREDPRQA